MTPIINVLDLIPQRPPFVLVDHFVTMDEEVCISSFHINIDHLLVCDGCLTAYGLIENMAQTAALMSGYEAISAGTQPLTGYIGSISKADILELPLADTEIKTFVRRTTQIMNVIVIDAKIEWESKIIASCSMKIILVNPPG